MSGNFAVTLINKDKGIDTTIRIDAGDYILDVTDEEGLNLPYSCRAGSCFDCLAKVIEGKVEQNTQAVSFLKPEEIQAGYVLLCSSCARSDCTIVTHQSEALFGDD